MTDNAAAAFFGSPEFERGRYGWAQITQPDGKETKLYRRATTIAGYLDDQSGLINWKMAMAAFGFLRSKSLLSNLSLLTWKDDKDKVKDIVQRAASIGGGDDAADTGTAFHKLVEMYHGGQAIDLDLVPDEFLAAFDAYKRFLTDHGITCRASEVRVVDDYRQIAGTADLVYTFDQDITTPFGVITAGEGIIADVKTGSVSELSGLKMGMQLAIYSHGDVYDTAANKRTQWPVELESSIGLVLKVDIDAGTVTPWWLNLEQAYAHVDLAMQASAARTDGKKLITKGEVSVSRGVTSEAKEALAQEPKKAPKEPAGTLDLLDEPLVKPEDTQAPVGDPEPATDVVAALATPEEPVDELQSRIDACGTVGELKDLYREMARAGKSAAELLPIAQAAQAKGAKMKGQS